MISLDVLLIDYSVNLYFALIIFLIPELEFLADAALEFDVKTRFFNREDGEILSLAHVLVASIQNR